jgi:hypothetical protein
MPTPKSRDKHSKSHRTGSAEVESPLTSTNETKAAIPSDDGPTVVAVSSDQTIAIPREMAGLLMTVGVAGVLLPGLVGTPFLLLGGLSLWPNGLSPIECWFRRRCPRLHREGVWQLHVFLDNFHRRFPL